MLISVKDHWVTTVVARQLFQGCQMRGKGQGKIKFIKVKKKSGKIDILEKSQEKWK